MLTQLIWTASITLEVLLLARGWQGGLWRRFPLFFGYVLFVVVQDIARLSTRPWETPYSYTYWITEYFAVGAGCAVLFEIYRKALASYPGAARVVRNLLLFIFAMAFAKVLANAANANNWLTQTTALDAERIVRTIQAIAIIALVSLFLAYSIPFGKNLRGILIGYSLFIAGRVICLPFIPQQGHNFWWHAYSASYIAVLSVWIVYLWSYQPVPEAQTRGNLERDYRLVAAATQRRLRDVAEYLRKGGR